mmetsp:Transcript_2318/g.7387  ORF Transcript_2318/g.7387 Transcript_2318/m.7387 type:complete len:249 (+) Transcript_2318:1258-2004(+)
MELVVAANARKVHHVDALARVGVNHGGSGHHLHLAGQQVGHQRALAGAWLADERHGQRHLAIQALAQGTQMREQAEHVLADAAHRTSASAGGCHAVVGHSLVVPLRLPVRLKQPGERTLLARARAVVGRDLSAIHKVKQKALCEFGPGIRGSADRGQQRAGGAGGPQRQRSSVQGQCGGASHSHHVRNRASRHRSGALCQRDRGCLSGDQSGQQRNTTHQGQWHGGREHRADRQGDERDAEIFARPRL